MGDEPAAILVEPTMRGLLQRPRRGQSDDDLLRQVSQAAATTPRQRFNWQRTMDSYTAQLHLLLNP